MALGTGILRGVTSRNTTEGAISALWTKNFPNKRTSPIEDLPDVFQHFTSALIPIDLDRKGPPQFKCAT